MITLNKREFRKEILTEAKALLDIASLTKGGLIEKNCLTTRDPIQSILYLSSKRTIRSNVIRPIVLEACLNSEKTSGKSGRLCLNVILNFLSYSFKSSLVETNEKEFLCYLKKQLIETFNESRAHSYQASSSSLKRIISQSSISEKSKDIIRVCFDLAGKSRKVIVDKGLKSQTSIILKNGYNFSLGVDSVFLGSNNKWDEKNVKCCIVDGTVLEVSEIHHLLEEASESGNPYIIFARDFSPDVLKTVSYNFARGTINVILVSVPLKESLINTLVDIATVCGTDVISSIKGDLISTAVRNDLVEVDSISCSGGIISIENASTSLMVSRHVFDIQSRISDIENQYAENASIMEAFEKKKQLLSDRVSTLISSSVSVDVGRYDLSQNRNMIEEIDSSIREIISHNKHGYIKKKDVLKICSSKRSEIGDIMHLSISESYEGQSVIPIAALYSSIIYSYSAIQSLCSIGCVLFYSDI